MEKTWKENEVIVAIFYYSALVAYVAISIFVSFFDDYQRKLMKDDLKKFFGFKTRERNTQRR
ncbi:MAG: hypothetical protein ABIG88_03015 [Patescibacteria group bacterium]|nr:hypothetical protein [Patescibacteria group bacterium]